MPAKTHLHLWDDRFLYVTPDIQSGLTARSSATLLVSATAKPFTLVTLDGQQLGADHSTALVATNAIASLAATDSARAARFVAELWGAEIPSGRFRYYDGMWYLMALLHLSGEFRVWTPRGRAKP